MTKIWLMGGFGNVLFQILAYRISSKKRDNVYYVKKLTEKNFLTKQMSWTIHQELYNDLILDKEIYKQNIFKCIFPLLLALFSKKYGRFFKRASFYSNKNKFEEKRISKNVFGYFQDKYFLSKYREDLLKLGQDLRTLYEFPQEKIVVHYRKGDTDWGVKYNYYYDKVRELLKKENKEIVVVTDSENEASLFFQSIPNLNVISSLNAIDDFKILISAQKLYCAPSTFSWWAAHSLNPENEIVFPIMFEDTLGIYVKNFKTY